MLSSKAKYALRALVCLAEAHRSEDWILASEIATAEAIPKKFLEAILVELRDEGIVKSRRGRVRRLPARARAKPDIRRRGYPEHRRVSVINPMCEPVRNSASAPIA